MILQWRRNYDAKQRPKDASVVRCFRRGAIVDNFFALHAAPHSLTVSIWPHYTMVKIRFRFAFFEMRFAAHRSRGFLLSSPAALAYAFSTLSSVPMRYARRPAPATMMSISGDFTRG